MTRDPSEAPSARIAVLGALELRIDGKLVPLRSAKQRALMSHLALAVGQHVPVDVLVDDLWPESPPRDPTHALQAQISRLRSLLPPGSIEHGPAGYRLVTDLVDVDVTEFARLCELARSYLDDEPHEAAQLLDRALELWRGRLLSELPDASNLGPRLVRLRELRRSAMAERVDAYLASGRADRVIGDLESALREDPLQERTWHQLMLALYRSGRHPEAMGAYRRAHTRFIEELGVEPGDELRRLHEQILHRELSGRRPGWAMDLPPPDPADLPPGTAVGSATTPQTIEAPGGPGGLDTTFTGRGGEWTAISRAWRDSRHGLQLVTLTGEPGIGKTHLVTEFAEQQRTVGAHVLYGHCDPDLSSPYQPFAQMLQTDADLLAAPAAAATLGRHLGELVRAFPTIADGARSPAVAQRASQRSLPRPLPGPDSAPTPATDSPPAPVTDDFAPSADPYTQLHRTFDAVAAWLELVSASQPALLVIDDAHWADEQTLMLINHLLGTPRRLRLLVLVTIRTPGQRLPDFARRTLLRQSAAVTHLPLAALPEPDVRALLHGEVARISNADAPPSAELTSWVTGASGGNPLLVVELARWIATRTQPGLPGTDDAAPLTWGVREVIEARLEPLAGEVHTVLADAAVLGAQFDPAILQAITTVPTGEIEEALRTAVDVDLLRETADGRLAFRHEIVRTALYQSLPRLDRAARHRRAAQAIVARHGDDLTGRHASLGHHFAGAHDPGCDRQAARHLTLAGQEAFDRRAPSVAAGHFRQALRLLPPGGAEAERCDLLIALGRTQARLADPAFRQTLLRAADIAVRIEDTDRLGDAVVANHRGWWSSTADVDHERVAMIETALANTPESDRRRRVLLLIAWSRENVRDPARRRRVLAGSEDALRVAEDLGDEPLLANVLSNRYAVLYAAFADPTECLHASERLLAIAHRRGDPGLRLNAAVGMTQAAITLGELAIADRYLSQAAQLAETLHQPARLWLVRGWQAMRQAMRGRLDEAADLARSTFELGRQTDQPDAATWYAGQLFTLHLLRGTLAEFAASAQDQVAAYAHGIPAWRAALALALVHAGQQAAAETIVTELVTDLDGGLPRDMLWLHGMAYLSGATTALGRADLAPRLYDGLAPHAGLLAHNGTIDAGPVDLHLGRLAHLTGDDESAIVHLRRAGAQCRRIDAPVWGGQVAKLLEQV